MKRKAASPGTKRAKPKSEETIIMESVDHHPASLQGDDNGTALHITISDCIRVLTTGTPTEQIRSLDELITLGHNTRDSWGPRGSVELAAPNRFFDPTLLDDLLACVNTPNPALRRLVILALGEWGDARTGRILAHHLVSNEETDIRIACLTALKTIGGSDAIDQLVSVAQNDSTLRLLALRALEELGAGGWADLTDPPPPRPRPGVLKASTIATLSKLSTDPNETRHMRNQARSALRYLGWVESFEASSTQH